MILSMGSLQYAFQPRVLLAVEGEYLTGGESFSGFGVNVDSSAMTVYANLHYLFPSNNPKFTPHVLGGIGYFRASANASGFGVSFDSSASTTGLNVGVGARWQVGENWGLRPEVKILIADGSSVRFVVGFYRSFGG